MDNEPKPSIFNADKVKRGTEQFHKKAAQLKADHAEAKRVNPGIGKFDLGVAMSPKRKTSQTTSAPSIKKPSAAKPSVPEPPKPSLPASKGSSLSPPPAQSNVDLPDDYPEGMKELDLKPADLDEWKPSDSDSFDWIEKDEDGNWQSKPTEVVDLPEDQPSDDAVQDSAGDEGNVEAVKSAKSPVHESFFKIKDYGDYVDIPDNLQIDLNADYNPEQLKLMDKAIIAIKLAGHVQDQLKTSEYSKDTEIHSAVEDYFEGIDEQIRDAAEFNLSSPNDPYDGNYDKLLLTITRLVNKGDADEMLPGDVDSNENKNLKQNGGLRDEGNYIDIPLDYSFALDLDEEESPLAMQARIAAGIAEKLFNEVTAYNDELDDDDLELVIEDIVEQHNVDTYGTSWPDEEDDLFNGDQDKLGETIYRHFKKLMQSDQPLDSDEADEDTIEVSSSVLVDADGNEAAPILPEPIKVSASKSGNVPHLASSVDATETLCGRPVVYSDEGYANYAKDKPTCKRCEARREADVRLANVVKATVDEGSVQPASPDEDLKQFMIKYEAIMTKLEEKAASFRPHGGTLPIGAMGAQEAMQASTIMVFMQQIRRGASPDAAAAKAMEEAMAYVNNHNAKRPKDMHWQRSGSWVPTFVETMKNDLPDSYEPSRAGQLASTQELSEEQIEKYFESLANSKSEFTRGTLRGFKQFFVKDITSEEWDSVLQYDNVRDQMLQLWQVADAAADRNPESMSIDYVERLLVDQGIAERIKFPAMEGDIEHLFLHDGQYKDIKDHTGEMFRGYDGNDYILDLPSNHPDIKKKGGLSKVKEAVDNDLAMRSELPNSAFNFWDVLDYEQILEIEGRRNRDDRFHLNAMRYVGELANAIQNYGAKFKKQDLINHLNAGGQYDDARMKRRSLLNGKPGQSNLHGSFVDLSHPTGGSELFSMWKWLNNAIALMKRYDQIPSRLQNETPQQIIASLDDLDGVIEHWNVHRDGDLQLDTVNTTKDELRELLVADLFHQLDMDREFAWDYTLQQYHQFFDDQNNEIFRGDDSLRPPELTADQVFPDRPASATVKVGHAGKAKNLAAGLDYNGNPIEFRPQHVADEQIKVWQERAREIGATQDNGHKLIVSLFDWTGNWSQPWIDAGYKVVRVDSRTDGDFSVDRWFYTQIEDWQDSYGYVEGVIAACPCTAFTATSARHRKTKHDREDDYGKEWLAKTFGFWSTMYGNNVKEFTTWLVNQTREIIEVANPRFHAIENPGIASRIGDLTGIHKPLMLFDPYMYGDPYTKSTGLWGSFNTNLPLNPVNPDEGSKIQSKLSGNNPMQKAMRSITPLGFSSSFFLANHVDDQYDRNKYSARNIQRYFNNGSVYRPIGRSANQSLSRNLRSIITQTLQTQEKPWLL